MKSKSNSNNISLEERLSKIDKKYYWIVAGLLAGVFLFLGYSTAGMLTSGMYVMERGDMLESHIAYIRMMCRHILNGETIFYSSDIGMGMNTSLLLAYYTMSPFNILFLLMPTVDDNIVVAIVMILKIAFASSFFQLFSKRVLKVDDARSIFFSIAYAFCGFSVAYGSYHLMWLDGFMLLPLVCFLIAYAFEEKKYYWLVIAYAYLFASQFYIGFMVGVFSFLFVLAYLIFYYNKNAKETILLFVKWGLTVVLAVLLSAVIWLPALLFLLNNNPPDATAFSDTGKGVMEIFNSMFWGQFVDHIGRNSFTYSSLPVLLLMPFYFLNDSVSKKERIISLLLIFFFGLCYIWMPLYKFMHAFDAPDYFWFRFSFLLSFILCAIAARQSMHLKSMSLRKMLIYVAILVLLYSAEMRIANLELGAYTANTALNLVLNLAFILAWCVCLFGFKIADKKKTISVTLLAILLLGVEVVSNMNICMYGKVKEDEYYNWEESVDKGMEIIKKNEAGSNNFYRLIIKNDMTHNSDSLFGYNGINDFGSSENYKIRRALANLGFGTTPRMIFASGYNQASDMLLGVKYIMECKYVGGEIVYSNDAAAYDTTPIINQYLNTLNLGYMVKDDMADYSFPSRNVFENTNDILNRMSGLDEACFTRIDKSEIKYEYKNSVLYQLEDEEDGPYYMEFDDPEGTIDVTVNNNDYYEVYVQFQVDEPVAAEADYNLLYGDNVVNSADVQLSSCGSVKLYYDSTSDKFLMKLGATEKSVFQNVYDDINYYAFDRDALDDYFAVLSKDQLIVDEYKAGYVRGHVNVTGDNNFLFTTIPYDEGWSVFVNGQQVETIATVDGAFLGIKLPGKNNYDIIMKYKTPGVQEGLIASLAGLAILVVLIVFTVSSLKKNAVSDSEKEKEKENKDQKDGDEDNKPDKTDSGDDDTVDEGTDDEVSDENSDNDDSVDDDSDVEDNKSEK